MPKDESVPSRKKMRKGTHSCFECRRRKIRCIFPPDNPDVCSECFARGSRCIDQEHADPDVVVDHRKNLRERVSRLEALVDSLLEEKTERSSSDSASMKTPITASSKAPTLVTKDSFPTTPLSSTGSSAALKDVQRAVSDRGHHVPILSAFEDALNDAEEQIKARLEPFRKDFSTNPDISGERFTVSYRNPSDMMDDSSLAHKAKKERTKQALLSVLPSFDKLNTIMNSNNEWWSTWRRKCSGTSSSEETLAQFASKAIAEGNIGAIGTVIVAIGICSDDEHEVERYIEAVDRWVLSDDEYAATLEGMELLVLKAKWYADVGQPRRAWLAYRKGLMYTQLMGIHRKRTSSAAHESIWWSLYHGDRFLSLLLGLPYGISDTHCDLSLPEIPTSPYLPPLVFFNKLSILSGKVIDRNQGIAEQSFAWALQLDQELEDLWKQLDPDWLEYSQLLSDIDGNAAELREKIMAQMIYHQIRVYLHLPFMLKSQANSRFGYSRTACLNSSREVLRLYQALRTGEVQPLYECKAVDFIGFTSAVLIVLGLLNFGLSNTPTSAAERESDIRLIEISIDIFRRASSEKGGKVALQSAEVLERMLQKLTDPAVDCGPTDFVIPYFGTISIKRGGKPARKEDMPEARLRKSYSGATPNSSASILLTPGSDTTPGSSSNNSNPFNSPLTSLTSSTDPASKLSSNLPSASPIPSFGQMDPLVSYDGFYNWGSALDATDAASTTGGGGGAGPGSHVNDDSLNSYPLPTNNFSWQNMPMDIDQDWSWFLNDGAATATGGQQNGGDGGNGGAGGAPLGDQFAQQGFVGFG